MKNNILALEDTYPNLAHTLIEIGPLPEEALFLGIAEDRLPVLLNMDDGTTGSILVTGDRGNDLLKIIALSANTDIAILTDSPENWSDVRREGVGIFSPILDRDMDNLIYSMVAWARSRERKRGYALLLIDCLEQLHNLEPQAKSYFEWLLEEGPYSKAWTIAFDKEKVNFSGSFGLNIFWVGGNMFNTLTKQRENINFWIPED